MRHVANADLLDIQYVVDHLSAQNDAERRVAGLSPSELVVLLYGSLVKDQLDDGRERHSEVALHEGQPVATYGIRASDDGQFNDTWFIAADRFFSLGVEGFRFGRTRVKYFRERYRLPLRALSLSPLAEAPKWFAFFGFAAAGLVDGQRAFIYR